MPSYRKILLTCTSVILSLISSGQEGFKHGLDSVFVEIYYIANAVDALDSASGDPIPEGAVTYRIYVDMAKDYKLQMMFSPPESPLEFKTTTKFYNNLFAGRIIGSDLSADNLNRNIMPLDSWISLGAASNEHYGIPKAQDPDGSILGGLYGNGGSESNPTGLLMNNDPAMGLPLTQADGLIASDSGSTEQYAFFGARKDELRAFDQSDNNGQVILKDFGMALFTGVVGPTEENRVLIAQLTTDGELSFKINLQLIAPYGGVERLIAENADPIDFVHPSLSQTIPIPSIIAQDNRE